MKSSHVSFTKETRPEFSKKAVITAGMPYGNKELHFGHIGGMFVQADSYARFLRDRIGYENVIFVSGTDCYGSPILEYYRQLKEQHAFEGTIEEFVALNHEKQKKALDDYGISPNFFGASSFGPAYEIHKELSVAIFDALYEKGYLTKDETLQFYDSDLGIYLNGRQVVGQCPIHNCNSEKGYADECSLGHQYDPRDLINPISNLTGKKPDMKSVVNWYFKLDAFQGLLSDWVENIKDSANVRPFILKNIQEFLKKPVIHIKRNQWDIFTEIQNNLPKHGLENEEKKPSFVLEFDNLHDRELACEMLNKQGIRFRTGKTLVPFRLTGNTTWGVTAPSKEGLDHLTFWVWPESLWAPISFTQTYLKEIKGSDETWKDWWCSRDCCVYQFIGEDNIYFYGPAEMAMFMALNEKEPSINPADGQLQLPLLAANNHILFLNKKAGSSSEVKPPMALELLQYYHAEQLRVHFLGLGLSMKSASFQPKPLNPLADEKESDPVLKEGNLLANVFNRLVRSCFYTSQQYYESKIPIGAPSTHVVEKGEAALLEYEWLMYKIEFHRIMNLLDSYIREANKYWVKNMKESEQTGDIQLRTQTLVDAFHIVRVTMMMLHPIAPEGTEMVKKYLHVSEEFFSWDTVFDPISSFIEDRENHKLEFLAPRVDFYKNFFAESNRDSF